MMKKVINLFIVGIFLLGMGAPLLAFVQNAQSACNMTCCMMEADNSDRADVSGQNTSNSCPMTKSSCAPLPVPQSLDIQADTLTTKVQPKFIIQVEDFGFDSIDNKTESQLLSFLEDQPLFHSQRDILSKHSILII